MKKTTLFSLGVFLLLLAAAFATREDHVNVGVPKFSLPKLDPTKVTALKVTGPHRALLERQGDGWTVADPNEPSMKWTADKGQVELVLNMLSGFAASDFISDKAAKHADYEVDDAKGVAVEVTQDGRATKLYFGKHSASGAYVRKGGEDAVFVARSPMNWQIRKDANGWRKRAFVEGKTSDLQKVSVKLSSGDGFAAERIDGAWKLSADVKTPPGFRFDPQAVDRVAQALTTLSAQDFAKSTDTEENLGFASPETTIEATAKDGKVLKVFFGKSAEADATTVPVKREGDPQIYLVSKWATDAVSKRVEDLRDLSLMSFEDAKAKRLTLSSAGSRVVVEKDGASWRLVEPKKTPEGFEFDPSRVTEQLSTLKGARATQVLADQKLAKPLAFAEVKLDDGKSLRLELGQETTLANGAKAHVARGAIDSHTYAVDQSLLSRLRSGLDAFKKIAPPPDLQALGGLDSLPPEIRAQLQAKLRAQGRP